MKRQEHWSACCSCCMRRVATVAEADLLRRTVARSTIKGVVVEERC